MKIHHCDVNISAGNTLEASSTSRHGMEGITIGKQAVLVSCQHNDEICRFRYRFVRITATGRDDVGGNSAERSSVHRYP